MIKNFYTWLLKPYPLLKESKLKILISLSIGFFVYFFLFLFKPFNINYLSDNERFYHQLLYGFITAFTILINYFVLPKIFPNFYNPKSWKVYKELIGILEILLVISILNWRFSSFSSFYHKSSYFDIPFFLSSTFAVGLIPITFYILLEERIFSKKRHFKSNILRITGENKNEFMTIPLSDLLFINSKKNYCNIYYLSNKKVTSKKIRISLNKIEKQFVNNDLLIRCHKSFIINKYHVSDIKGNSRGYKLIIKKEEEFIIPVSRKFTKKELE